MNIFGKRKVEPEIEERIEEQKRVSKETLEYVRKVLARKDELLSEAVNQTGAAVRKRRSHA